MIEFAKMIHGDDDGYITVSSCLPNGQWRSKHFNGADELLKGLKETYANYCDIYMSVNSFYIPQRNITNITKLNAIYIDIDCHDANKSSITPLALIADLYRDLFDGGEMPIPTAVASSGRGIHLYWAIDPAGKTFAVFCQAMTNRMCKTLRNYLKSNNYNYDVDFGASNDLSRVMRIPGTYNQKNGSMCKLIEGFPLANEKYTLSQINEEYELDKRDERPKRNKKDNSSGDYLKVNRLRLHDFEKLRDLRKDKPQHTHCQKRLCFYYRHYALLAGYDADTALEMTHIFNEGFRYPIDEDKLEKHTKSAETAYNKGVRYRYKTVTLINELDITQDEMVYLKTIVDDFTRLRRRNAKRRRTYGGRDYTGLTKKQREMAEARKLVAKYDAMGMTQSAIADKTGFSQSKVARLRAELRSNSRQAKVVDNNTVILQPQAANGSLRFVRNDSSETRTLSGFMLTAVVLPPVSSARHSFHPASCLYSADALADTS